MSEFNKYSTDGGATFIDVEDSKAVHYGDQSKGYVGKNRLVNTTETSTVNTVVFTVNADKSVTVNGTPTTDAARFDFSTADIVVDSPCIFSGVTGGSDSTYSIWIRNKQSQQWTMITNPTTIQSGTYDRFRLQIAKNYTANNLTFYPMVYYATISDDTYEPYLTPNTEIDNKLSYADNNIIGAKNFIKFPFDHSSRSYNGVTFTGNDDGSVTISTENTGASSNAIFNLNDFAYKLLPEANYILSDINGYRDGSGKGVYTLLTRKKGASGTENFAIDTARTGSKCNFTVDYTQYDYLRVSIFVPSGTIITTPVTLYPMIQLATDTDTNFIRGALSNIKLNDLLFGGTFPQIELTKLYGEEETPINIDKIDKPNGYMYRIITTSSGFSGTAPNIGNGILLIGLSKILSSNEKPQYGVQIAIGISVPKIAIRNRSYISGGDDWDSWKYITGT